jgi:hypothetical protein
LTVFNPIALQAHAWIREQWSHTTEMLRNFILYLRLFYLLLHSDSAVLQEMHGSVVETVPVVVARAKKQSRMTKYAHHSTPLSNHRRASILASSDSEPWF